MRSASDTPKLLSGGRSCQQVRGDLTVELRKNGKSVFAPFFQTCQAAFPRHGVPSTSTPRPLLRPLLHTEQEPGGRGQAVEPLLQFGPLLGGPTGVPRSSVWFFARNLQCLFTGMDFRQVFNIFFLPPTNQIFFLVFFSPFAGVLFLSMPLFFQPSARCPKQRRCPAASRRRYISGKLPAADRG